MTPDQPRDLDEETIHWGHNQNRESGYGPFLPFAAVHQFDRCWGRSVHCVDIVDL
jgi:hypothetical protein